MTTTRLCPSFHAAQQDSHETSTAREAPALPHSSENVAVAAPHRKEEEDDDDDEWMIPTWDDKNGIIHLMFHEDDENEDNVNEGSFQKKKKEWLFDDSSCSSSNNSNSSNNNSSSEEDSHRYATAPEISEDEEINAASALASSFARALQLYDRDDSVEPTEETTEDEESIDGTDSNAENLAQQNSRNLSIADEQLRFSIPKQLLQKSTNLGNSTQSSALKSTQTAQQTEVVTAAVQSKAPGEVWIRADLLKPEQLPEVLDMVRAFDATRKIVLQQVHQGSIVEAMLIFFFQSTPTLRALSYSGSWISPSLLEYLASKNCHLQDLELGISFYRTGATARDFVSGRPGRPTPRRNIARQMQRLEDLEEALAANTSLRSISLLPDCHLKVTEGLLWAATCHESIERIHAVVPMCTPQNTLDVHESGLLIFEGLKEVVQRSRILRELSLLVDPSLCRLRKKSHELLQANCWEHFAQALTSKRTGLTRLKLEFASELNQNDSHVPRDMTLNIMRGIMHNTSLKRLELVNVPVKTSIDFWHGVQMRSTAFEQICLRACPEVLSFCMCSNDPDSEHLGWLRVHSLVVDQASLDEDLFGLQVLANGGLKEVVVADTLTHENIKQFTELLTGCTLQSLVMGHDSPRLLLDWCSETLRSLELQGGQYPVSSDALCSFLDASPGLQNLKLKHVKIVGDWSRVRKRMESHSLETLEIVE